MRKSFFFFFKEMKDVREGLERAGGKDLSLSMSHHVSAMLLLREKEKHELLNFPVDLLGWESTLDK